MTGKSPILGWVVLLMAVALGASACSDETAEPESETTRGAIALQPLSSLSVEDWALEVDAFIDEQNAKLSEVRSNFQPQLSNGPEDLDVEIAWLRAERGILVQAFIPGHPDDDTFRLLYDNFLDGQEGWVASVEAAADALEAEADTIKADWADGANPRHVELTDIAFEAMDIARRACSELADAIMEVRPVSVDCLNQTDAVPHEPAEGTQPETDEAMVGEFSLSVTGASPVNVGQESPKWVQLIDAENEFVMLEFVSDPRFADPADLSLLGVSGDNGWPEDVGAWLESVGAQILDSGATTVSGYETGYWQFIGADEENVVSIIGKNGLSATDVVQLPPGQVSKLYRIETPGRPIMGLTQGFDRALVPADAEIPPFFPDFVDVDAWAETLLPFVELS